MTSRSEYPLHRPGGQRGHAKHQGLLSRFCGLLLLKRAVCVVCDVCGGVHVVCVVCLVCGIWCMRIGGGQLNIIDRFIFVDPEGNVVDEKADMWTETGLDPGLMHQKMLQAQQAGFHRSDQFWEQHFDEFAELAARTGQPIVDQQHFDHPVELNFHGRRPGM